MKHEIVRAASLCCVLVATACGDDDASPGADGGRPPSDAGGPRDAGVVAPVDSGPAGVCVALGEHAGEATYYSADGSGNCGFAPIVRSAPLLVAALNRPDWAGSAFCGACAHVVGPSGEVTVKIVDSCPGCASGDLDLSPDAFAQIAALSAGRVPITWREVPCDAPGPLVYHFKDGSNPYWTAIQIRDHRHRIAKLEARGAGGAWSEIARVDYNYFVATSGLGDGPYALRVTDVHGHVVSDEGVPALVDADHPSASQFPACE